MQWELSKKTRLALAGAWFLLTFSLSAWWMVRGMTLGSPDAGFAERQHRMFFWEGSFLLSFILFGGVFLFYAIYRDLRRNDDVRRFFATFTHELKTSLTSLRLQAEILDEDPRNRENENLRRLLRDVVRLELQLENALALAQAERGAKLFLEEIPLEKTVKAISIHWPQLSVKVERDARVQADQRALECILKNLLQNASVHGQATQVNVLASGEGGRVHILVADNGRGFTGRLDQLGDSFVRHTTRSGSGIGLYLSRILAQRMGGQLSFSRTEGSGLRADLEIAGRIA
ncbi:MAG: sensor histidine kinase [Bdellovibrionota bacterium]